MSENVITIEKTITISPALAQRIQEELGENVYLCYQCVKCSSGCPLVEFFDWQPNQIMRALQLGQEDIAFESQTPWLCASCQTCTTRCPQGININAIMDFLTQEAITRGFDPPVKKIKAFNEAFLREIRIWGRAYEPGLMAEMGLRYPKSMLDDIELYTQMLRKMKVSFFPSPARPPRRVKPVPGAADAVAYYPGCSLHSTAPEFNVSTKNVCKELEIELIEPKGWICCGSSAAHRADPAAAALIEQSGFHEVTMPCAACFNRHKAAQFEIHHDSHQRRAIDEQIGYTYLDNVQVNTLIQTIHKHVGAESLSEKVKNPLKGLRVVCYYGCLLTRPPEVTQASHPENPTDMDKLLSSIGAEVLDWSYKTDCCGAAHALTRPDIVVKLSGDLVNHAHESSADVIAVACPLCHLNLDARQFQMDVDEPVPVLFFTQLMAIALGLPEKAALLSKNLVDPRPILKDKGLLDQA